MDFGSFLSLWLVICGVKNTVLIVQSATTWSCGSFQCLHSFLLSGFGFFFSSFWVVVVVLLLDVSCILWSGFRNEILGLPNVPLRAGCYTIFNACCLGETDDLLMAFSRAIAPLAKAQLTPTKRKKRTNQPTKKKLCDNKIHTPKRLRFLSAFLFLIL